MTAAFLVSMGLVAIAEIGDKTQLLSLLLAARYRTPFPIIAGVFFATLANHALAGLVGEWVRVQLGPANLRWVVGGSLIAMAVWTLKPDKIDAAATPIGRRGLFLLTLTVFFIAEIGDKTQIATVVLAAKYHALAAVVLGTTLGMMIANVPVILLGKAIAARIPLRAIRIITALIFAAFALLALLGVGQ